jgi:hypothetical protein
MNHSLASQEMLLIFSNAIGAQDYCAGAMISSVREQWRKWFATAAPRRQRLLYPLPSAITLDGVPPLWYTTFQAKHHVHTCSPAPRDTPVAPNDNAIADLGFLSEKLSVNCRDGYP